MADLVGRSYLIISPFNITIQDWFANNKNTNEQGPPVRADFEI